MNVLSLFDGMGCGRIALEKAGVPVGRYFASEIDKYAIWVTQRNYPDTIQLGDISKIRGDTLPRIDLVIGGSPCQGFSVMGKGLNFSDPRSVLFFEFIRLLEECNPRYFLLENVMMERWCKNVITKHIGVRPLEINSALVSAQNRRRLYWTNIPGIRQPKDRGVFLKDIVESGNTGSVKGGKLLSVVDRHKGDSNIIRIGVAIDTRYEVARYAYSVQGKSPTLRAGGGPKISLDSLSWRELTVLECGRLQTVPDRYTEGVSRTQQIKMLGNGWTVNVIRYIFECMLGRSGIHNEGIREYLCG